jgi:hypothetical protein
MSSECKVINPPLHLLDLRGAKSKRTSIIAVHGLNGHAYGTWTCCEDSRANIEPMWLRDFLPNQLPSARILVYGYNSAVMGPNSGVSGVRDFALDLLQRITDNRVEEKVRRSAYFGPATDCLQDPTRPIIFICHSLGGIVVKQVSKRRLSCKSPIGTYYHRHSLPPMRTLAAIAVWKSLQGRYCSLQLLMLVVEVQTLGFCYQKWLHLHFKPPQNSFSRRSNLTPPSCRKCQPSFELYVPLSLLSISTKEGKSRC